MVEESWFSGAKHWDPRTAEQQKLLQDVVAFELWVSKLSLYVMLYRGAGEHGQEFMASYRIGNRTFAPLVRRMVVTAITRATGRRFRRAVTGERAKCREYKRVGEYYLPV